MKLGNYIVYKTIGDKILGPVLKQGVTTNKWEDADYVRRLVTANIRFEVYTPIIRKLVNEINR